MKLIPEIIWNLELVKGKVLEELLDDGVPPDLAEVLMGDPDVLEDEWDAFIHHLHTVWPDTTKVGKYSLEDPSGEVSEVEVEAPTDLTPAGFFALIGWSGKADIKVYRTKKQLTFSSDQEPLVHYRIIR